MLRLRFDVNDLALRDAFLGRGVADALGALRPDTPPRWGRMTAQEMAEHLVWGFDLSIGRVSVPCAVPEARREAWKRFLHDGSPMMREFRNPLLVNGLPPLRHARLDDAVAAVRAGSNAFREHAAASPEARYVHPVFGPLGMEEWARVHYKHCFHHLQQFDLLSPEP
jgi:hypothetical protein